MRKRYYLQVKDFRVNAGGLSIEIKWGKLEIEKIYYKDRGMRYAMDMQFICNPWPEGRKIENLPLFSL